MSYFKEIDPFGNISCVYESDEPLSESDVEIDADEYIEESHNLFDLIQSLNNDRDRGGPAI